jgi:E3 ubiquitin-protein ligase HECTD4
LRTEELNCGDAFDEATELFAKTVAELVAAVARRPQECTAAIGNLCVIPYKRSEEKCLLQSQLVRLLDELCDGQV